MADPKCYASIYNLTPEKAAQYDQIMKVHKRLILYVHPDKYRLPAMDAAVELVGGVATIEKQWHKIAYARDRAEKDSKIGVQAVPRYTDSPTPPVQGSAPEEDFWDLGP